jgi:alkyl sulfatase BDS1-like metallo-beta-lactamase superfamily hydrolase
MASWFALGLVGPAALSIALAASSLAIVLKQTTFAEQAMAGKIAVAGDSGKLIELLGLLDEFDPMFAIVAPKQTKP